MTGLTSRQRELLAYISERDICPSYEEMRKALGAASLNSIARLVGQLEDRGRIHRLPRRARAIEVIPQRPVMIDGEPYRFIPKTRSRVTSPFRGAEPAGAELAPGLGGRN